jgi:hypothetical protein
MSVCCAKLDHRHPSTDRYGFDDSLSARRADENVASRIDEDFTHVVLL